MTATWERRKVPCAMIATDSDFRSRHGRLDGVHVKTLATAIRRSGSLTPVTLWAQGSWNSLIVLDGEHRIAAYRAAGWSGGIPARVVACSRREALLIAASANTRDVKPLSLNEKADIAWKLVREPDAGFSKWEIARASGVSERTVATMRARWRTLEGSGMEPSGRWWQDRMDVETDREMGEMTDAQRRAHISELADKMRKAAGNSAFRDEQIFAEALDVAFGARLRVAIDWLYGPDEVDEWASLDVSDLDLPDGNADYADDEPEPAF